jgi:hypothetical protein
MDFGFNDLYPNQGFFNTRAASIPEAADQVTLADDTEAAAKVQSHHDPALSKRILIALAVMVVLICCMGWK